MAELKAGKGIRYESIDAFFDSRDDPDDESDPFYSESNMAVLLKSIQDAEAGKLSTH